VAIAQRCAQPCLLTALSPLTRLFMTGQTAQSKYTLCNDFFPSNSNTRKTICLIKKKSRHRLQQEHRRLLNDTRNAGISLRENFDMYKGNSTVVCAFVALAKLIHDQSLTESPSLCNNCHFYLYFTSYTLQVTYCSIYAIAGHGTTHIWFRFKAKLFVDAIRSSITTNKLCNPRDAGRATHGNHHSEPPPPPCSSDRALNSWSVIQKISTFCGN
jgi:hypothetical protein